MRVILTGSTGFIGKHLLSFLLKNDFEVISTVRNKELDVFRDSKCISYEEFYQLEKGDLPGIEAVIHLAGAAHRDFSVQDAKESNETLTLNMVAKSKTLGIKRFILISSVGIYHERSEIIDLNTVPSNTQKNTTFYKLRAENIVINAFLNCSTDYVILRLPLVYGNGVKANFSALMKLSGKKLPLPFGAITSNKRSLVSVYNLIDLIKVCIEHPKASNQTFLVSDGDDLSTTAMVKLMADVQGVKPLLFPVPVWFMKLVGKLAGKSDMISRLTDSLSVDITHTKKTLNWIPPFSVNEGFAKCIENKNV